MRYPDGHKENVRQSIVGHAARALRGRGISGVSVPVLMKKAGLTHGGFYAHFKNRDELVAEAILNAAEETAESVLSEKAGDLSATLDAYLSMAHISKPEHGCVLAALGSEGRMQSVVVRRAFAKAAKGFIQLLKKKVKTNNDDKCEEDVMRENKAMRLASMMLGAVVLSRLVEDPELASKILNAVRSQAE